MAQRTKAAARDAASSDAVLSLNLNHRGHPRRIGRTLSSIFSDPGDQATAMAALLWLDRSSTLREMSTAPLRKVALPTRARCLRLRPSPNFQMIPHALGFLRPFTMT